MFVIKLKNSAQTNRRKYVSISDLTIVFRGATEWTVGSGSKEKPCGGSVWGTALPSIMNWMLVTLKGWLLAEVTHTELFGCRRSENRQLTDSDSSSDNVNIASAPASRWKPTSVKLVPPDTGPLAGWKSASNGCCSKQPITTATQLNSVERFYRKKIQTKCNRHFTRKILISNLRTV